MPRASSQTKLIGLAHCLCEWSTIFLVEYFMQYLTNTFFVDCCELSSSSYTRMMIFANQLTNIFNVFFHFWGAESSRVHIVFSRFVFLFATFNHSKTWTCDTYSCSYSSFIIAQASVAVFPEFRKKFEVNFAPYELLSFFRRVTGTRFTSSKWFRQTKRHVTLAIEHRKKEIPRNRVKGSTTAPCSLFAGYRTRQIT